MRSAGPVTLVSLAFALACGGGGREVPGPVLADKPFDDPLNVIHPKSSTAPELAECGSETKALCEDLAIPGKWLRAMSESEKDPPLNCGCDVYLSGNAGSSLSFGRHTVSGIGASKAGTIRGSALSLAALKGEPQLVNSLLLRGADPNGIFAGSVPLDGALAGGDIHCARLLLEHGADPALADLNAGVGGFGEERVLMWLVDNGGDASSLRPFRPIEDQEERLATLVKAGMMTEGEGDNAESLLSIAIKLRDPVLVRAVIDAGADVNSVNPWGKTPLQQAENVPPIAAMLKMAGAE